MNCYNVGMLHGDDHAPILIFVVHMDLYYFATKYIHVQVTNAASCTRSINGQLCTFVQLK
jgi:hypothetical protein